SPHDILHFYLHSYLYILNLHSFPTRRSSDLSWGYMRLALARPFSSNCLTRCATRFRPSLPNFAPVITLRQIWGATARIWWRNERSKEHTSELQSRGHLVCRLLLEKKK